MVRACLHLEPAVPVLCDRYILEGLLPLNRHCNHLSDFLGGDQLLISELFLLCSCYYLFGLRRTGIFFPRRKLQQAASLIFRHGQFPFVMLKRQNLHPVFPAPYKTGVGRIQSFCSFLYPPPEIHFISGFISGCLRDSNRFSIDRAAKNPLFHVADFSNKRLGLCPAGFNHQGIHLDRLFRHTGFPLFHSLLLRLSKGQSAFFLDLFFYLNPLLLFCSNIRFTGLLENPVSILLQLFGYRLQLPAIFWRRWRPRWSPLGYNLRDCLLMYII